jgi:hypothetical protein
MPNLPQVDQHPDSARDIQEQLHARIGRQVIRTLGAPDDLLQVQVRPLWENFYRVNIFVGVDAAWAKIANSYFVQTDRDGKVVASTPRIMKQYEPAGATGQ